MSLTLTQRARSRIAFTTGGLLLVALALSQLAEPVGTTGRDVTLVVSSVLAGYPIAVRAWQALRAKAFSIDLLVTIAVIGALVIGEYVEAAVVSFLFLFGAWLEARSLERTRASLRELVDLAPTQATVLRDGQRVTVDADDVALGETVLVTNGERIAVDGTVSNGTASVTEASITGEPVPVTKQYGDRVFAGTIAESGYLEVVADRVGDETTFARIIELVEEAQESRTRRQRFLERFAQIYTPAIVILAVIVYAWTRDLGLALTFLVIACPGALVISVPVAAVAGLGNVARHGVLVKGGEVLEDLAAADTLVLDKTGTLTVGRPVVTAVQSVGAVPEGELLELVGTLESTSEHHLARAIVSQAQHFGMPLTSSLTDVEVVTGLGIAGRVGGRDVLVGRRALLAERGVAVPDDAVLGATAHEQRGATVVHVAVDGRLAGLVAVADEVREEAAGALTRLRESGIRHVVMLTGDNAHTARLVGDRLGLDEVRAGLLPEDKARIVEELRAQGRRVAMIGDGVNDAPTLATADVGIAMGGSGTDVSMETADVVLMTDRLDQFAHARRVARATVRVMKQNTALALATVGLLVAGVLLQYVQLAGGMLVHEISVLLVILNALRLVRLRGPRREVLGAASTAGVEPEPARQKEPAL
ncbi:MAG: cation-translocating P-type ATPase [Intrasporangium sp.]|uniref:heavy metal translocating P-type ATPase n=1 Tax=Intrasporangium sp. TaxID=1925024 RepID=UPI002648FE64|nr:cation-translocating P-type ATPase [Intrasporangium sp.]MDN5796001.1 cation-translocating P-type ATPase [Intrasporangium sp.]